MTDLIMSLKSEITVVIIEHDIDVAFSIADRVSVLHMVPSSPRAPQSRSKPIPSSADLHPEPALIKIRSMPEPLLKIEHLDAYYGKSHILQESIFTSIRVSSSSSSDATAWVRPRC